MTTVGYGDIVPISPRKFIKLEFLCTNVNYSWQINWQRGNNGRRNGPFIAYHNHCMFFVFIFINKVYFACVFRSITLCMYRV
jgi:hypothetical protein